MKKNRLNWLKFWKNWPVRFWFYKSGTEKTKSNLNKKKQAKPEKTSQTEKPSQTGKNRAKPVWTDFFLKNRTEQKPVGLNRFRFGFGFFFLKIILVWLFFWQKPNQTENEDHYKQ